jgi:Niemann-Pick C1 protein
LKKSFVAAEGMLGRCPTCYYNFRKNFCDMTCRPDQSLFLKTKVINATKIPCSIGQRDGARDGTETALMVKEVTYYANESFAIQLYDSCKNVYFAGMGSVMGMMCGSWGAQMCNHKRFFEFLGDGKSSLVPFQITYNFTTNLPGVVPYNPTMLPCSQPVLNETKGCSCSDCHESCKPPKFPDPPGEFVIVEGVNGVVFIMVIIFVIGTIIFLAIVAASWALKRNISLSKSEEDNLYKPVRSSPTPPPEDHIELSYLEKWGSSLELHMTRFFTRWGKTCSKYPVPVIILSVGLALGLSTGINWLQVKQMCNETEISRTFID